MAWKWREYEKTRPLAGFSSGRIAGVGLVFIASQKPLAELIVVKA